MYVYVVRFFFKQKTAYEMRISDWSSDVCSSDLIDESQVEAVTATGARRAQTLAYGIAPQIMPAFAGISVCRWDINIRESTVLGLVGAGGIGLQLNASINLLAWTQVSVILLVIIATVVVSEWVSAKVRHAII